MPLSHSLLALAAVFIWGTNFVVIKWGLAEFPAFLFATLRFLLSALPWILVFRRPAVPWRVLACAGLLLGVGQFGLLYWAMRQDISPGLASLVIQSQVFFTILISVALHGERVRPLQLVAAVLAVGGYGLVAWRSITDSSAAVTLTGLGIVLTAGVAWACTNMVMRGAGRINMLAFTAWSSLFAIVPLALISIVLDGPSQIVPALGQASGWAWLAALWQAVGNTVSAFGAWGWLLARHPAATVTPMALLVPVFGILASVALLDEPLPGWKIMAAGLVLAGLSLNMYASRAGGRR